MRDYQRRPGIGLYLALAGMLLMALSGCSVANPFAATSAPSATIQKASHVAPTSASSFTPQFAGVTFQPSVDYLTALQRITNLGLQPLSSCLGAGSTHTPWRSSDQTNVFTGSAAPGLLRVATTPLAPADWQQRLASTAGVKSVYSGVYYCPNISADPYLVSGKLYFLDRNAPTVYVRVTFFSVGAGAASYAQSLKIVSDLGFRLADPCFEGQVAANASPAWHAMSQQSAYATTGQLVIATTVANAQRWQSQLTHAQGVTRVEAPYTPTC